MEAKPPVNEEVKIWKRMQMMRETTTLMWFFRGICVMSNDRAGDKLEWNLKVADRQEPQIRGSFIVV